MKQPAAILYDDNEVAISAAAPLPVAPQAGELHVGEVGWPMDLVDCVPVLDTAIYAAGDVLWTAAIALTNILRVADGKGIIRAITIIDEDDQGVALDLFVFGAATSLGAVNGVPGISDAGARDCLGFVSFATTDYIDLGGVRVAHKSGLALPVKPTTSGRTLWLNAITRGGTPTYTAAGLRFRVGIEQG